MDVIIFGTGKVGREALPFLETDHHVLFYTDNEKTQWGNTIGLYEIKPPAEIQRHACAVVIASARYGMEIAGQLCRMGLEEERLYFCRRTRQGEGWGYEIYPCSPERIPASGKTLIRYDLLHMQEQAAEGKKVLVFCTFFSTYAKQLLENLSKRYADVEFSILTSAEEYKEKVKADRLKHIYCFQTMGDLKAILEQLPVYDAMQLLWIEREWAYFWQLIRNRTRRLNLNVGGSDFYRAGDGERAYKRALINSADCITAETEGTAAEFGAYYGKETADKMGLLPFGIEVLGQIDQSRAVPLQLLREKYHIPPGRMVVTCGHNANSEHQHEKMTKALGRLRDEVKQQIVCVFPMTYPKGQEAYIEQIESGLKEAGLTYVILRKFMDFQEMAEYALLSDIMLHVQRTDQLSSTMLEEMYAGSVVLAGKWLPYESLHKMGIFFLDVESVADITQTLETVVYHIEEYQNRCRGNREIIHSHSSWDVLASRWRALCD